MRQIDKIAIKYPDNLMWTGHPLYTRQDVEEAFVGSGLIVDPFCRVRCSDHGLLATFRAGDEGGEMEPWFAIAWGILREDERETWLGYWHKLDQGLIK